MLNARGKFLSLGIAVGLALASPSWADHLPENKIAAGKSERLLCGINPNATPLKDVLSKLGKPDKLEPDPLEAINVTYNWHRESLRIKANTYHVEDYNSKPPIWIEVSGADPSGFCKTGRGLRLGDTIAEIYMAYGRRHGTRKSEDAGGKIIVLEWKDGTGMDIEIARDGRISKIILEAETE